MKVKEEQCAEVIKANSFYLRQSRDKLLGLTQVAPGAHFT